MKAKVIMIGVFSVLMSACSGLKVVTDQKANINYAQYQTYELRYESDLTKQSEFFNELNITRFENELLKSLGERGMIEDTESPNVYIDIASSTETLTNYSTNYNNMGGRRFYGNGYGTSNTREYSTKLEKVVIALRDGETDELLWYASLTKELKNNPKKAAEIVEKAVDRLMESFPIDRQSKLVELPVS
ncbi:DUF4136 domain-containing protein [Reichenbachiella sp.]|uniref:DUF4136 domain-containing protein n=1 Tax=Reichenbachiella sp. TaxID=2184521 RepID=UPI003BB1F426